MVQYSLKALEQFPEIEFHQRGYLFLGNESNWGKLQRRYEVQRSLGAVCELLSVAEIRRLVPELRCDDLVGGLMGPKDGYVDPGGLHWRSSPNNEITIAKTDADEPPGFRFGCDLEKFHEELMPVLVHRLPEFRELKLVFGWGGLYEMTPDQNGIIDKISDGLF